ncbi:hypothetical protein A11A3_05089 [Alcanivorax hongdengensis A-11-3]|uniref:PhoD-like phosphatase metallophosphatase domain-containing protein n=1 Tax=Alcanivorax hongdengensis A-11-3 TaxID=1177179 RepID=L0WGU0_9GAMM|nr:alkaline phosphatase D family protein [Alcanivorax hongdengensis]EKF75040.1 hypothetical protein A11A3_05089 [Alcanivorax hongdengensis A-11-3]
MTEGVKAFHVGPLVGESSDGHARIFAALPENTLKVGEKKLWGRVRWRRDGESQWQGPLRFRLNGNFDGSGVVVLNGLQGASRYQFQAGWVDSEEPALALDWQNIPLGYLQTDDDQAAASSFVFGSCCYRFVGLDGHIEDDRGDKIFSEIRQRASEKPIDFVLFGGDQVYADSTYRLGAASSLKQFHALYRESFSQPRMAQLLREYNHYMILDDHEIENNWPARADAHLWTSKYPAAIKAYQIYQASHSPAAPLNQAGTYLDRDPDRFWYTFRRGPADFFVLDARTERVLSRWPWQRRMVSDDQEAAFVEWLNTDTDRIKVLVSTVVMFPEQRQPFRGKDAWEGFRHQRQRFLRAMANSEADKLVVLSGDVHASLYAQLKLNNGKRIHSWTCSGLFWPTALMAFRWYRPMLKLPGLLRGGWGQPLGRVTVPGEVYSRDAFSRVTLDEQGAHFELFDRRGEPLPDSSQRIQW